MKSEIGLSPVVLDESTLCEAERDMGSKSIVFTNDYLFGRVYFITRLKHKETKGMVRNDPLFFSVRMIQSALEPV